MSEGMRDLVADINTIQSVTFDNGSEFAEFKNMEEYLNCKVYFTDIFSPWQRGLNEYSNRLIRQYLRERTDSRHVTQKYLDKIIHKINSRP